MAAPFTASSVHVWIQHHIIVLMTGTYTHTHTAVSVELYLSEWVLHWLIFSFSGDLALSYPHDILDSIKAWYELPTRPEQFA